MEKIDGPDGPFNSHACNIQSLVMQVTKYTKNPCSLHLIPPNPYE